jgi:hypothetical protein
MDEQLELDLFAGVKKMIKKEKEAKKEYCRCCDTMSRILDDYGWYCTKCQEY